MSKNSQPMTVKVFRKYSEIPPEDWDKVAQSASVYHSRDYLSVLDEARLNDFSYRYLLVYSNQLVPVAAAVCYVTSTDLAIFAQGRLRAALRWIREWWPGFLKIRMLECGTPISVEAPFAFLPGSSKRQATTQMAEALVSLADSERAYMIVARDFYDAHDEALSSLVNIGFVPVSGPPIALLQVRWESGDAYLQAMKSYFRSKLKRHLKLARFDDMKVEVVASFDQLSEELHEQWMNVHQNAKFYQREVLTPVFFRLFSARMEARSKVLLCFRDGNLAASALLLEDGRTLRWMFSGKQATDNDSLYLAVAYCVIVYAIENRFEYVDMGSTTYSIKKDLGAIIHANRYALRPRFRIASPLIRFVYPLVNRIPDIAHRRIFKENASDD